MVDIIYTVAASVITTATILIAHDLANGPLGRWYIRRKVRSKVPRFYLYLGEMQKMLERSDPEVASMFQDFRNDMLSAMKQIEQEKKDNGKPPNQS